MAHGRNKLEGRYAVLSLKALGNKAVSHKRAVAGSIHLHGALAEHGEVVVYRNSKLRLRHRAHVAGDAELLCDIEIMQARVLIKKVCREHRGYLAQDAVERREAHHYCRHCVFVPKDALFRVFYVVARSAVAPYAVINAGCNVLYDEIHRNVGDAQSLVAQTDGEFIEHVRYGEIVSEPSVAEHRLDVTRLYNYLCQYREKVEPSCVVVQRIL